MVSSSIVDKYIGESARLIREMFNYARDHQPCIIFMDEIDAIGNALQLTEVQTIIISIMEIQLFLIDLTHTFSLKVDVGFLKVPLQIERSRGHWWRYGGGL